MHRRNPGLLFLSYQRHHLSLNCYDSTSTPLYSHSTINCRAKGTNVELKADARRFAPAPLIPVHAFRNQDNQSLSLSRVIAIYRAILLFTHSQSEFLPNSGVTCLARPPTPIGIQTVVEVPLTAPFLGLASALHKAMEATIALPSIAVVAMMFLRDENHHLRGKLQGISSLENS